jgi:hypothetical protein
MYNRSPDLFDCRGSIFSERAQFDDARHKRRRPQFSTALAARYARCALERVTILSRRKS